MSDPTRRAANYWFSGAPFAQGFDSRAIRLLRGQLRAVIRCSGSRPARPPAGLKPVATRSWSYLAEIEAELAEILDDGYG